jgi:hypothetical protein
MHIRISKKKKKKKLGSYITVSLPSWCRETCEVSWAMDKADQQKRQECLQIMDLSRRKTKQNWRVWWFQHVLFGMLLRATYPSLSSWRIMWVTFVSSYTVMPRAFECEYLHLFIFTYLFTYTITKICPSPITLESTDAILWNMKWTPWPRLLHRNGGGGIQKYE